MINSKITPYLTGLVLNIIGFFVGSNIIIGTISKYLVLKTEYHSYLLWCILGLLGACIGNIVGVLLFAPRNFLKTIIGSLAGLIIGIIVSCVPMLFFFGIASIFIGTLIGHRCKNGSTNNIGHSS